ncbi:MAG: SdrD B-like domain-containing protein, partial [Bacteroidota bacterium]
DFGYYKEPAAVGNFVFNDTNSNGIQDNGETGIEGVSVTLDITYPDGTMVRVVAITDANGFYEFPNLLLDEDYSMGAGNPEDNPSSPSANMPQYTIFINTVGQDNTGEPLGDLVPTAVDAQGTGQQPSDAENINGVNAVPKQGSENTTAEVDETMEANEAQYDFGFTTGLVGIGGTVWADQGTGGGTQNDGTQDGGEQGVAGVTLELLNDVGTVIATTTTNADGTYLFEGLQPGDYQVRIPSSNFDDMGDPLQALPFSSVPTTTTNNDDSDNDDNGSQAVANGAVTSPIFTLSVGGEPSGADEILTPTQDGSDGSARDLNTNTTVDFGFQDFVVPVELLYFQAKANKDHIDLIWSTASEINNSHFDIERSEDGKTFKSITQVQGSGTTLEQTDYKHEDREAIPNVLYYYRLKQVDFGGAFEYSEIRAAQIESDRSGIALYPNPIGVNQALQVRFFAKDTEASFVIMDIHGKPIIRVEKVLNTVGWHTIQIDITKLAAGTYLLVSDSEETMRFIITEE